MAIAAHPALTEDQRECIDIATPAVFLARDDAGWIHGQLINAAGGAR